MGQRLRRPASSWWRRCRWPAEPWAPRGPTRGPRSGRRQRRVLQVLALARREGPLDKLGIKLETEVIPLDAFVAKTLPEFNSGQSPWDLIMFGGSNMPDYGRHFEPLENWIEKLKLEFYMDDIPGIYTKLFLRHQGKIVAMPYDGDVHMLF